MRIFLNAKGTLEDVSEELMLLLDYIAGNPAKSNLTQMIDAEIKKIKENKEWRREYTKLYLRDQENIWIGEARGEARGRVIGFIETLQDLNFSQQEILKRLMGKFKLGEAEASSYFNQIKYKKPPVV